MPELIFIGMAVLVGVAGWLARRRIRAAKRGALSDDLVRQIEMVGRVDVEDVEPVDLKRAHEEEDEFWGQTWDEPEEL